MIRRPPSSTQTDTLFPYTTLFRSQKRCLAAIAQKDFLPTEPIMEMLGQAAVFLWRCCADIGLYGSLRLVLVIEPLADQRRRSRQIAGEDVLAVTVATTHLAFPPVARIPVVNFHMRTHRLFLALLPNHLPQ